MAVQTQERIIQAAAAPAPVAVAGNGAAGVQTDTAVQALMDKWRAKLEEQTAAYKQAMTQQAKDQGAGLTGPVGIMYPWWNLIIAGPYQVGAGAFLPNKIVRGNQPVVFLGALWRNPLNFQGQPLSAAHVLSQWDFAVTFQSVNLTTVTKGPNGGPIIVKPDTYPPNYVDIFAVSMTFSPVLQGTPHLYEVNAVVDLTGPAATLPFAGYSTWLLDPDIEYPFWAQPFPPMPQMGPRLTYDQPARILVYA